MKGQLKTKKEELTKEEKTLYNIIQKNPGKSILELVDISPFTFDKLVQLLRSLKYKNFVYSGLKETEKGEDVHWYTKREVKK
ncbi:MAG: hypothetical protein PVF58_22215 [Candidatus Methanofastidiosia archaeon]